ncbi:MAG: glycine C-acetyltransferase [Rickettsiales bacterium]|jgi:glycine C-acetyltransferase
MIDSKFLTNIEKEIEDLKEAGIYKGEYQITTSQDVVVDIIDNQNRKKRVINFCANNYLGLANAKNICEIAKRAIDDYGFGTASVRFICGTMDVHKEFEKEFAEFLGYEDVITFASCFGANGGVFNALFDKDDAIISADLNHASLIDGIRLCKAKRFFYKFDDMSDLELKLKEASKSGAKNKVIVTDGVFSMDGDIAPLEKICDLAEKYNSLVLVDDCHATGFIGKNGRGTIEATGVFDRVDILTTTLGKSIGGSGGGIIASKAAIIDKLRNKARTYLFSNNISPSVAKVSLEIIREIKNSKEKIKKLAENTKYFRVEMERSGLEVRPGYHPIVPIMFYDEKLNAAIARDLIEEENIYVIPFSYPVVPKGEARIRVQLSSSHTKEHLDKAVKAFTKVADKHGALNVNLKERVGG